MIETKFSSLWISQDIISSKHIVKKNCGNGVFRFQIKIVETVKIISINHEKLWKLCFSFPHDFCGNGIWIKICINWFPQTL